MLIILAGLLRYYELGMESIRLQVVNANPHHHFDFAILTTYTNLMSYRDKLKHLSPRGKLPEDGNKTVIARLVDTFGQNVSVVFELSTEQGIPGRNCGNRLTHCMTDGSPDWVMRLPPPPNRKPFFELRVAHGLYRMAAMGILTLYDHVLALRFDASLTKPLHIEHTCRKYPGVNMISASWKRIITGFPHNRDIDLAYLGCNVSGLLTYLYPYYDNNGTTRSESRFLDAYQLPSEFSQKLTPHDCKPFSGASRYECESIVLMAEAGVRLGTLDEADVFVNLINWAYSDGDHRNYTRGISDILKA